MGGLGEERDSQQEQSYTGGLSELSIRAAQPKDEPAIRRLVALYPNKLVQEEHPATELFFVAESDGVIVGCCALDIYSKRLAEVRSLAVRPEDVHGGVGAGLVEACKQRAREQGVRQLLAVSSAAGFFEKVGFSTFKQERIALFYDVEGA